MRRRPLAACLIVEGQSHILEWTKAPYTIFAAGERTDWNIEIGPFAAHQNVLEGLQGPLEEYDRLRIRLQINPKSIRQTPQPLAPVVRRLGEGEALIRFWGAKLY